MQMDSTYLSAKGEAGAGSRQQKTATLSVTIETINLLSRCCSREAKLLEQLRCSVDDIRNRVQHILEPRDREQHGGVPL